MISFRPLNAEDVEVRVGRCTEKMVELLLYKTARTDMMVLDETVGPENWQCRYVSIDGKLYCELGIKCGDEWVWKSDTGTESNMESQKGEASDAFKRAGFRWGIGRELYSAPRITVLADKCSIKQKNGKYVCYDMFRVTDMEVSGGRISRLEVANMSRKGAIVFGTAAKRQEQQPADDALLAARKRLIEAEKQFCVKNRDYLNSQGITTVKEFHDSRVKTRTDYAETPDVLDNIAYELRECTKD